jgi:hypothetical protein
MSVLVVSNIDSTRCGRKRLGPLPARVGPLVAALALLLAGPAARPLGAGEAQVSSGAAWERIAQDQGVTVEEQAVPGLRVPRIRGTVEIARPLYDVLAVLLDSDRHVEWMPGCMESRAVRSDGIVRYVYNRTDTPWPFRDRDVVLRSHVILWGRGERVETPFESTVEPSMPPLPDAVRMPLLRGHYRLERLGPALTRVELQLELDPGGMLPAWMIRYGAEKSSIDTLVSLREQVWATHGGYAAFIQAFLAGGEYERL